MMRTLWALPLLLCAAQVHAQAKLQYNRDIRPILMENCFSCHGPDSASRKADMRLDQREQAIKAGAIAPGKLDKSALIARIFSTEKAELMPPPKSHKTLTTTQKETLKKWIAEGAEYQLHWSLLAPQRPALPPVKNQAWVRSPLDQFILAELEKRGLQPAAEADRRTLARRAALDLTGLPPVPAEVEAFVKDAAPDAYERYVDNLLKSPHWGEHRGRYWLDAARYADTHGIHFDNFREMWSYRDWVIKAFNDNMPFDQFTIEQLAGDLLPNRTVDQQVATGFNRCNITTSEGGAINEEYLVLYTRDRTETVAQVWLGLTAGCAVCHSHKFDPLSQRDFYAMSAFFNNTTQNAMDGNIKDTPPILTVPRMEDRPRFDGIAKELAAARTQLEAQQKNARPAFAQWLTTAKAELVQAAIPTEKLHLHAPLDEGSGNKLSLRLDGKADSATVKGASAWDAGQVLPKAFKYQAGNTVELPQVGDFEKSQGFSFGAWVKLPAGVQGGAIFARMDDKSDFRGWDLWVEGNKVGTHIINKWPDDALKVTANQVLKPNVWQHVFVTYDGSSKAAGVTIYIDGVRQDARAVFTDKLQKTIKTQVPLKIGQRHTTSPIVGLALQDVRIYSKTLGAGEVVSLARSARIAALIAKAEKQRTPPEVEELFGWWLPAFDKDYQAAAAKVQSLQAEEGALRSRGTIAHVMQERAGEPTAYLLHRGDYDKRRDLLKANTPEVMPPMPADLPKNRLGFAKWLLRPEQPLAARVTVNRFWQEVFGVGLVRTAGDFGVAGELPSHPELLDWLAVEFREKGWDMKSFYKMLVTSATYRQAATTTPEKLERDPHNTWLSRGPRYRLDAEMIRDYALAASGLLARKLGGPSVKPYQPEGVWEAVGMIGSNTRDYRRDSGESLYRRSMYIFWKRAAPPAQMEIFNAPNREACTVRRERTNTPLQALATLNDPQYIEAARFLAQRALKEGGATTEHRLDFLAQQVLARPFRVDEQQVVQKTLTGLLAHYKAQPQDAAKLLAVGDMRPEATMDNTTLAAWTMMANTLFNLDEALNK